MRKRLLAGLVGMAMLGAVTLAAPASAGSSKHLDPGIPGTGNCIGLTTAYVAQGNPLPIGVPAKGIGNVAQINGVPVDFVTFLIYAYCTYGIV